VSGNPAVIEEGGGIYRDGEAPADTAWVKIRVSGTGWMSERDFATLVRDELPAHVCAELWIDDRLVWSSADQPDGPKPLPSGPRALPAPPPKETT
jgi:hypothetical protein